MKGRCRQWAVLMGSRVTRQVMGKDEARLMLCLWGSGLDGLRSKSGDILGTCPLGDCTPRAGSQGLSLSLEPSSQMW